MPVRLLLTSGHLWTEQHQSSILNPLPSLGTSRVEKTNTLCSTNQLNKSLNPAHGMSAKIIHFFSLFSLTPFTRLSGPAHCNPRGRETTRGQKQLGPGKVPRTEPGTLADSDLHPTCTCTAPHHAAP